MRASFLLLLAAALGCRGAEAPSGDNPPGEGPASGAYMLTREGRYRGMGDASAAVAVSSNLFLAANDEDNALRLYRSDPGGAPVRQYDLNRFLELEGKSLEADLEGAARIGDRVYWIGSHGRNKNGKARPNRARFFATDIRITGDTVNVVPVGRPYKNLLEDLIRDSRYHQFRLGEASRSAPKEEDALDIEGLAATPEGHLLIGFRNPIPGGQALVASLLNPDEVITGTRPRFGPPLQWDLGGLGIRDFAYFGGSYLIIGGSYDGGGKFKLYQWRGGETAPVPLAAPQLNRYNPEAIAIYPEKGLREFQVLSDDGTLPVDGVPGKEVKDPSRKSFRGFWLVQPRGT